MAKRSHPPSMFRSEEMVLCHFVLQSEVAFACVERLGRLSVVQFRDINSATLAKEREYFGEISILMSCNTILKYLETQIKKNGLELQVGDDDIPTPFPGDLIDIRETLEKFNTEVRELESYIQNLKDRFNETIELKSILNLGKKHALLAADKIRKKKPKLNQEVDDLQKLEEMETGTKATLDLKTIKVNVLGGVVRRERFSSFETTLWRATRGSAVVKFQHIDHEFKESDGGGLIVKTAFIVFFQGEKLKEIVTKIMDGYRAKIYSLPEESGQYDTAIRQSDVQRKDLKTIINVTEKHNRDILDTCAQNLEDWYSQLIRMRAVYDTLNGFAGKPSIGEGWVALSELPRIKEELQKTSRDVGGLTDPVVTIVECDDEPPTYFWTDKYTKGFQNLIDAYGIATYKEVNPMPFTVITFPFLFSMMFGDLGHGLLLLFFGGSMVIREKSMMKTKSKNEIRNILFAGRYIVSLMGIFSIYSGLIYNDCFSVSLNIFGSSWKVTHSFDTIRQMKIVELDPKTDYFGIPYPLGLDPMWEMATNKIIFLNSFKMKASIIFGVLQMVGGLFISLWNNWYFGEYADIFCMFIPQLIWLLFLFGWLCVMMFFKWVSYSVKMDYQRGPTCAPSVLIHFIDMFLQKTPSTPPGCLSRMFEAQGTVQTALFLCAIICIPWILLAKPIWLFTRPKEDEKKVEDKGNKDKDEKKKRKKDEKETENDEEEGGRGDEEDDTPKIVKATEDEKKKSGGEGKKEEEKKSELMIHQAIITIEYILGTISHTASYLRLWALSLAHAQLSAVLWNMVLGNVFKATINLSVAFIPIFFIWGFYAILTVGILCIMEGLSAFLHTLRLHWVEFNSKFYTGIGYEFAPFSFQRIINIERS